MTITTSSMLKLVLPTRALRTSALRYPLPDPVQSVQRCLHTVPPERPPPALQDWINEITSRPPTIHYDSFDSLRASQLIRSLPTRQHLESIDARARDGHALGAGHHMIYFQPETMLCDLGPDGSSPVRQILLVLLESALTRRLGI